MQTQRRSVLGPVVTAALLVSIGLGVLLSWQIWWPKLVDWVSSPSNSQRRIEDAHEEHDHPRLSLREQREAGNLKLSPQALKNLGLTDEQLRPIALSNYRRTISMPAVVVPKPGRSAVVVSSPLSGVVTHVHVVQGESVLPGDLLFEVRLTYEDLVETQTAYLRTISELEVENREIARLEGAATSGAISTRQVLERRYAKEKLEAFAKSQREALRLHGLSDRQIDAIAEQGALLRELQIVAPDIDKHDEDEELRLSQTAIRSVSFAADKTPEPPRPLVLDDLRVHKGQSVVAGEQLCTLSEYSELFIEGKAFESDWEAISTATEAGWEFEAVVSSEPTPRVIEGLELAYVANSIDPSSRTLSLFVELPNQILRDQINDEGQRFIDWRFRVGQRIELRVPVEQWDDQFVLPSEAVAKEGADWFVFKQVGSSLQRIAVHVLHRDSNAVVIANDGSIFSGNVIAHRSAHQLQMAYSNRNAAPIDPHAGHNH